MPWSCPRGLTLERWGWRRGGGSFFFFQTWSCGITNRWGWRAEQNASKIFILGSNWWPWGEVKMSNIIKFGYYINFKDFYTKLCVCCTNDWNERNKTYQMVFSFCHLSHAPGVGLWGAVGCPGGRSIFFQTCSCGISNRRGWRAEQNASKF